MNDAQITAFRKDSDGYSDAAYLMLCKWKQRAGPEATYWELYDSLCHGWVKRRDLAEEFCVTVGRYWVD